MNLFDLPEPEATPRHLGPMCAACGNQPPSSPRTNTCARCESAGLIPQRLDLDAAPEPAPRARCSGCPWNAEHADACPGRGGLACGFQAPEPDACAECGAAPTSPTARKLRRCPAHWNITAAVDDEEDQDQAPRPLMSTGPADLSRVEKLARYGTTNPERIAEQLTPKERHRARCDGPLMAPIFGVGRTSCAVCDWSPSDPEPEPVTVTLDPPPPLFAANGLPADLDAQLHAWMADADSHADVVALDVVAWIGRGDRLAEQLRSTGLAYGARCADGVETFADTVAEAHENAHA